MFVKDTIDWLRWQRWPPMPETEPPTDIENDAAELYESFRPQKPLLGTKVG